MPRLCSVCAHPARAQIDEDLLAHEASYRVLAHRYGVHWDALQRHEHAHLGQSFRQSQEAQTLMHAERLITRLMGLEAAVDRVLARSEQVGDDRLALLAIKEGRANVDVLARIGVMADLERRVALLEAPAASDRDEADDGSDRDDAGEGDDDPDEAPSDA